MEVLDAIRRRRAVRDYKPEPVAAALLQQIVGAAGWAPSAMNEQPWHFTVITDHVLMERISDDAKRFLLECAPIMPRADHFMDLLEDSNFNIFYNAPVLLVLIGVKSQLRHPG